MSMNWMALVKAENEIREFFMDHGREPTHEELENIKLKHPDITNDYLLSWARETHEVWKEIVEEGRQHWLDCKADQEQKERDEYIDTTPDHIERSW